MSRWEQKVVLVTGGSAGLGLAIAAAFAKRGARLMLVARDEARLKNAVESLDVPAEKVGYVAGDVTIQNDVQRIVEQTIGRFGQLDVLVNCAGRSARGAILDTSPEDFRDLIELNFLAVVRCTQVAAPHLLKTQGHVVHIGSLAAKTASRFLGAYPASKFPLAAYAQQMRLEHEAERLHVLLVCPGPIARLDAGARYDDQANAVPDSARKPGGGAKLKTIDPDWLAGRVVAACEKRHPEIVVPGKARLLFAIAQLWPTLGDWILKKKT